MENKRINVFWGAGRMCRNYLGQDYNFDIKYIIDNDKKKVGSKIYGISIITPDMVENWGNYFVIIVSQYYEQIRNQMESLGLMYKKDFIDIQTLYLKKNNIKMLQKMMEQSIFENHLNEKEIEIKVRSKEEYENYLNQLKAPIAFEKSLNKIYDNLPGKVGFYEGFCETCGEKVNFQVDYFWSKTNEPAWRETLICPYCNCNSRMRKMVAYVKNNDKNKKIFIYEKSTWTYKAFEKFVDNLTGSEYLSPSLKSGDIVGGILHEDAMNLSFSDDTFDTIVSNDVFEHVGDFQKAFQEAYRCLIFGGKLLISIPIFKSRQQNKIRANIGKDGLVQNKMAPEYHGNPLSEEGSLVFTEFGWDIINRLKECGFRDVYANVFFSVRNGYFGDFPVFFEAIK